MLLVLDIGNSDITFSLWDNGWGEIFRIPSKPEMSELFYGIKIRESFNNRQLSAGIKYAVISSVVPGLTEKFRNLVNALFNVQPIVVGPSIYPCLPVEILNPFEIGSDLVANAVAAFTKYKRSVIVVDFGTALTFTTVLANGKMAGVSIAPGLKTAIKSLSQNTAKLFEVGMEVPSSALGTNTATAIQTGIFLGYEGLVRTMILKIRNEVGEDCIAVATGGLSSVIPALRNDFYAIEPTHTLDGLRMIAETVIAKEK